MECKGGTGIKKGEEEKRAGKGDEMRERKGRE